MLYIALPSFMKIIISRKGFDTTYGGRPSPILPDGTILSLPIPSRGYSSDLLYDGKRKQILIKFRNLQIPHYIREKLLQKGIKSRHLSSYHHLMTSLFPRAKYKLKNSWLNLNGKKALYCHLDPDIYSFIRSRPPEWRALFGQVGAAQSHLRNQKVGKNDIFLFFGWFQETEVINGDIKYKGAIQGKHILFGYFQVEKIIRNQLDKIEPWMEYHPHCNEGFWKKNNNTIYVARNELSFDSNLPGAGYFQFSKELQLTESDPSINPNGNLTKWKYEFFPSDCCFSINTNTKYGKNEEYHFFKALEIGQEVVVSKSKNFTGKIKSIISKHIANVKAL